MQLSDGSGWRLSAPLEVSSVQNGLAEIEDMSTLTVAGPGDLGPRAKLVLSALAASAALAVPLVALTIPTPLGPALDSRVLLSVNAAAARIPGIDVLVHILDASIPETLLATGIVALWFSARGAAARAMRHRALLVVLALFPAYGIARVLQHADHRLRPILAQQLHPLTDPVSWHQARLNFSSWGSFPSDHATLLAIVVVAAFTLNRRVGFAFALLGVIVSLFRVAIGYHWPSDVVGGTLLGIVVAAAVLAMEGRLRDPLDKLLDTIEAHRALAYPLAFFGLVELSQGFALTRLIAHSVFHARVFH